MNVLNKKNNNKKPRYQKAIDTTSKFMTFFLCYIFAVSGPIFQVTVTLNYMNFLNSIFI